MTEHSTTEAAQQAAQRLYNQASYTIQSRKTKSHDGGVEHTPIDAHNAFLLAEAQWAVSEADEYGLSFGEALCDTPTRAAVHAEAKGYAAGYADAMAGYKPQAVISYLENLRFQLISEGKY